MSELMTKEAFKDMVRIYSSEDTYGNLIISAALAVESKVKVQHYYRHPEVIKDTESRLVEELWHTVYGSRRSEFAKKCAELHHCTPNDFEKYHELVNEIMAMAHAL